MNIYKSGLLAVAALLAGIALAAVPESPKRVTILYDSFTTQATLAPDWGFAAFVEYGGRRILFDTGGDADKFAHNARRLGVDLERLDAVVISHRHHDHTGGLEYLHGRNPQVKIYVPDDDEFDGHHHADAEHGRDGAPAATGKHSPLSARFETVTKTREIFPGFYVFTTRAENRDWAGMNEVSLAIRTPKGLAVVVGCSHPGVEKILAQAASIDSRLYTVTGGFHLISSPASKVRQTASILQDTLKVERVAPSHCTSDLGFEVFENRFKQRYDRAGLGAVIPLP